ncbi:hypothetical protein P691DRAFT_443633 [Macrolepiota fuliginosa MF-IS2]|uniref:Zn(2)-C6 fungal-type domain-containing protein n=1 Tax=Macrolepiota fuliginosa MF-IS2 TaxID=1400762 RepID=A0A9P5XNV8_9AGAR|nr:hypothetical protein P691DRAFT_443633 [Macrolepiota fuliginosa MF-IS2]
MPPYPSPYDIGVDSLGDSQTRRRRGATRLNCAECRRLKLRCDRATPCSSCVKRGCGAICPDGSLTTGQGNRFVLASTEELHQKNLELAYRIRDLEDALRNVYSDLSTETHPLLSEELLKIKTPLQREAPSLRDGNVNAYDEDPDTHNAGDVFGSMTIQTSGKSKFYGHTANSYYFIQGGTEEGEEGSHGNFANLQSMLPREILQKASVMPISSHLPDDDADLRNLLRYLPSSTIAYELRTIYYSHAAWMYSPISVGAFDAQVYSRFYGSGTAGGLLGDESLAHGLALMFMVLAIGSLMDATLPAYNLDAEQYHQLARAALFHTSIFSAPTLSAVQALFLMSHYLFLVDRHGAASEARWLIMGIVVKVAQSIGLHRDSGHWNFDLTETRSRREIFWEIFTYDSLQCLTFGRPPSFIISHIDCKPPYLLDSQSDEQAFHSWKHRFTLECMTLLHSQAFGARTPTYATVLQLDKKIRTFPIPPILQLAGGARSESRPAGYPNTVTLVLQRHIVLAIRETNLLYLHRGFFAKALSKYPDDPLRSPYHDSVMAAYHSAETLVGLVRNLHSQLEVACERMWFLWAHIFSCSIILGSIVTRCPFMSIAPSALDQLDLACELFSKTAAGFRATNVLRIMLRLQQRAHRSMEELRRGRQPGSRPSTADGDGELTMLRGNAGTETNSVEPTPSRNRIPSPSTSATRIDADPRVEYMQSFGQLSTPNSLIFTGSLASSPRGSVTDVDPGFLSIPSIPDYGTTAASTHQIDSSLLMAPVHQGESGYYPAGASPHYSSNGVVESSTTHASGSVYSVPPQELFLAYSQGLNYGAGPRNEDWFSTEPIPGTTVVVPCVPNGSPEPNMHSVWQDFISELQLS